MKLVSRSLKKQLHGALPSSYPAPPPSGRDSYAATLEGEGESVSESRRERENFNLPKRFLMSVHTQC